MRDARTTIARVTPLADHWLRLEFADNAVHEIDLGQVLASGGVFAPIYSERDIFESVAVDRETGTIVWPGDVDLDPDVLRGDAMPASGLAIPRRVVEPA